MTNLLAIGSAVLPVVALAAQAPDLPPLHAAMDGLVAELRLDAAGLAVLRAGGEIHRSVHGTLTGQSVMPIASASKWLAVATILVLADEGVLDLDAPVARYVAEFDRADKRTVTLRQCLSCSAGFAPRLPDRMRGWDMAKFAAAAADAPLRANPGTEFRYGGVGYQVAALAAERATGKTWHTLFAEKLAGPLGLAATRFGTLLPIAGEPGTASLPWVAGGAESTLDDYARFLAMLVDGGRRGELRILKEATVAAMLADQVPAQVDVQAVGFAADRVRYGLGTWLEPQADGGCRASDPGAFGFTPWIDLDLGIGGVFAVRDRVGRVLPQVRKLQNEVRTIARSPLVAGEDSTVTLPHGGRDRRYHLHVPPQAKGAAGLPLLVVLHGGGGHGEQVRETTGFCAIADREGFVVAFPDGTGPLKGRLLTWNSGGIPVYATEHDVDDVGFLRAVVTDVQKRAAIDPARVFAAGHSNGAMMCHRLAREAADVFAGVAAVAGAMNFTERDDQTPVAALLVHGTADQHVLYHGGAPREATGRAGDRIDASVQGAIDYYVKRNGLRGYPDSQQDGKVRIDTYGVLADGRPSGAPVRVITLDGGGHAWPGGPQGRLLGDRPFPFAASAAIWQFFATVGRAPGAPGPSAPR